MAARQSLVLLLNKTKNGLNNRRRSLAEVDKRSELDGENRPIYTQKSRVEGVIIACRVLKFNRKVPRITRRGRDHCMIIITYRILYHN